MSQLFTSGEQGIGVSPSTSVLPMDIQDLFPFANFGLAGDQSWVFIGRTDVEGETPIFWPPHVNS